MKARAENLKPLLCAKTPEVVERTGDKATRPIEKNAAGVSQANLVSDVEDNVDISARNNSVIGRRRSQRIGSDRPIALDEPSQRRLWLELIEGHQSRSSHTCNDLQRLSIAFGRHSFPLFHLIPIRRFDAEQVMYE